MINKVLIVGGSGYLGHHLIEKLAIKSTEIHVTGLEYSENENYHRVDFSDPSTFNSLDGHSFDIVFILASKLNSLNTIDLNHSDLTENTIMLGHFLEYLKSKVICGKLIYMSSMTVYDENNSSPVSENSKLSPLHIYGLSKVIAENIISFFCVRNEIKNVIIRIPGLYGGDRKSGIIYNTIKKLKANQKVDIDTKGLGYWETINIEDLCTMIINFIEAYKWEVGSNIFNFSYGEEIDFNETIKFIGRKLDSIDNITFREKKGYTKLYLSNKKLSEVITIDKDYYSSLERYIKQF